MLDIVQLALLDEAVIAVIIHEVLKGLQYLHEQVCSSRSAALCADRLWPSLAAIIRGCYPAIPPERPHLFG